MELVWEKGRVIHGDNKLEEVDEYSLGNYRIIARKSIQFNDVTAVFVSVYGKDPNLLLPRIFHHVPLLDDELPCFSIDMSSKQDMTVEEAKQEIAKIEDAIEAVNILTKEFIDKKPVVC